MILKKLLLTLSTIITLNASVYMEIEEADNSQITINSSIANKAWIGIYRVGTDNSWENVQEWGWATNNLTTIDLGYLKAGDYEARLFYNNSFVTEEKVTFTHEAGPSGRYTRITDQSVEVADSSQFTLNYTSIIAHPVEAQSPKEWVGIYKKGVTVKRENLLAWGYLDILTSKESRVTLETLNKENLPVGEYNMVYHQNDNYKEIGINRTLTVEEPKMYVRYERDRFGAYGGEDMLILGKYQNFKQENDWVAIFKKDAEPIKENIIAWSYIRDGEYLRDDEAFKFIYFKNFPTVSYPNHNTYKAVVFANDSYEILGQF